MSNSDAAIVARWKAKRAVDVVWERTWKRRHTYRQDKVNEYERSKSARYSKWRHYVHTLPEGHELRAKWYRLYQEAAAALVKWTGLRDEASRKLKERREAIEKADAVIARHTPVSLRERAYKAAASQVGVMESGGNNQGTPYTRYQKPNGATGPEPWCGDFMAWVYRQAGSKAVQRLWASVYFLGRIAGLHKTSNPERGDLVRFVFDHVGMFVAYCDANGNVVERSKATHILTIEGNTGSSGAVSDGNGNDGVYRKVRALSLVQDYLRVER